VSGAAAHSFLRKEEKAINNNNNELFINEQIRDREVRVVGEDGEQLGVMPIEEALRRAEDAGLDLVKIAPTAKPPVCKIVDYGKYKYDQLRKAKEAKKKQKIVDIKEIRMSPNIDTNDLNTKINAARKFLTKGNRVKFTIRFRGREMAHMGASVHILTDIAEELKDVAVVEKEPRTEGRFMNMIMAEKR
jgi:translation initiation factor IF-3